MACVRVGRHLPSFISTSIMTGTFSLEAGNGPFNNVVGDNATPVVNHIRPPGLSVIEYAPPQRVNNAPVDLLAANFMGRLGELSFLLQVLDEQIVFAEEGVPTRCAVYGMPGVGKTKLILRFAQIVFAQLLYYHVFWVSATTTDKLVEGMVKILDHVKHPERIPSERNEKLTAARLWLEDSQRTDGVRWLLIVDNVDRSALDFLREHLPQKNGMGSILFTTRSADVADALVRVSGRHHSKLELCVPDLAETTDLLFTSAGVDASTVTSTQKSQAEELVQTLGSLPLAVVQVASHMRQTDMALDKMLEISNSEHKFEGIEWESDLAVDQQKSVVATFGTLLDRLERDLPETYDILRILSFLDPEDIPLTMLTDGARMSSSLLDETPPVTPQRESSTIARITKWTRIQTLSRHRSRNNTSRPLTPPDPSPELRSLVSLIRSPTAFYQALDKLQSLSLVESLSRGWQSSLRMHDLLHLLTREHVKRRMAYQAWLESAVSLVCSALRHVEDPRLPHCWPECEKLMPHVRSLSEAWTGAQGVNLGLASADVCLAQYLSSRGRYEDAERSCERGVGSFRKELGETHKDTLAASYFLSDIHFNQGRLGDAEETLKHVLEVAKKDLGVDHENTLQTMNNLALLYRKQRRYRRAEQLFKQLVAIEEKKWGDDHPSTLTTMHNLASVYRSQKRYGEAEELYKHVLDRQEKCLGPDHVSSLSTAHNLAIVYGLQRKYIDAEEMYKRDLVGCEKQLGPNHPDTLTTVMNLASLYRSQARYEEAERFFLRALTGRKQHLGARHPSTLRCVDKLAGFYRWQGRNSEADALLEGIK